MIRRIFVEKKKGLSPAEEKLRNDIFSILGIKTGEIRRILRYDVENITEQDFEKAVYSVFAESPLDNVFYSLKAADNEKMIITEYLPGQFDQRADSAMQCVQLLTGKPRPLIRCATVYLISDVNETEAASIKKYLINPVEAGEGSEAVPETLASNNEYIFSEDIIAGFISMNAKGLESFYVSFGFAMSLEDLSFVQKYFAGLKRNPTLTELKVIDTYWSDHCRHTTFLTELKNVEIVSNLPEIEKTYKEYCRLFNEIYTGRSDKYKCLMDVATIAVKKLRKEGYLSNLDISEEVNACSVRVNVDVDGADEEWLIMFKNETHNHPTEIEPFGGAATCLGGAIRDPLSGRSYVYQAMRVTGSALGKDERIIPGKLPQRVITKTAAAGFSSYGNQIGLATGTVKEYFHEGFKAKRLETGYVIGGAPAKNVVRISPQKGDVIILLGGDTGRDGCGGATGSSKTHTVTSLELCGAEVQKGNAPEERKLQRFFRNPRVSAMIKKCNDFGAGGVCVAIGELADGLDIFLHKVPKKNNSLTPTELAISESQERMAVVVAKEKAEEFISEAEKENLKATEVALVTDTGRMRMFYYEAAVADIEREFLDTNGVRQSRKVKIIDNYNGYFDRLNEKTEKFLCEGALASAIENELSRPEICSTKGLGENFDSTIGAGTVLMPFGGKNQITPCAAMAAKPPLLNGYTKTVTVSSSAYYPYLMSECQYLGSIYSVIGSLSKQVASGASFSSVRLTFQEYFKRLGNDPVRWGTPLSALLGALDAQLNLKTAAIGGKDSMSGSFDKLDVPPTLISFAMGIAEEKNVRHNAWSGGGKVYYFAVPKKDNGVPDYKRLEEMYGEVEKKIKDGTIKYTAVTEDGGIAAAAAVSLLANGSGMDFERLDKKYFKPAYGGILAVAEEIKSSYAEFIGTLNGGGAISLRGKEIISGGRMAKAYCGAFDNVFPSEKQPPSGAKAENVSFETQRKFSSTEKFGKPRVFIPVFPGTNCEYDTAKAFTKNGGGAEIFVIKNYSPAAIAESVEKMSKLIASSQIIAFPGGFSGGDEPDGSGKFIAAAFKNPYLKEAVAGLLDRGGLILGICNGFQALIKLGLLPYGKIAEQSSSAPTLTFNNIGRHVSAISRIRIASNNSPWLQGFNIGEVFNVPVSHGEGKFICREDEYKLLAANGQIATQYVDASSNAAMVSPYNPNGSYNAVEGILSPDGKVFGKMGHSERYDEGLYLNVEGNYDMNIFRSGIQYFK